jgi:hypothetical protein
MLMLGVVGEYVGRIYYEVKRRPHFLVKATNAGLPRQEEGRRGSDGNRRAGELVGK